jgi:hypothetical protein
MAKRFVGEADGGVLVHSAVGLFHIEAHAASGAVGVPLRKGFHCFGLQEALTAIVAVIKHHLKYGGEVCGIGEQSGMTTDPSNHGGAHIVDIALYFLHTKIGIDFCRGYQVLFPALPGVEADMGEPHGAEELFFEVGIEGLTGDMVYHSGNHVETEVAVFVAFGGQEG